MHLFLKTGSGSGKNTGSGSETFAKKNVCPLNLSKYIEELKSIRDTYCVFGISFACYDLLKFLIEGEIIWESLF